METAEQILERIRGRFPAAEASVVPNPGPAAQHSLLLGAGCALGVARFLRDEPGLQLDYCSNVTGIDRPGREPAEAPKPAAEVGPRGPQPGHIEVVYHLFSVALRHGPVVIRMRTGDREGSVTVPSLTPVWRSCEFQEREVFDLFGVVFAGHPDLRRILMWDEFKGHPMRRDYAEADDYEWEPTPHGSVLAKARQQGAARAEGPNP